MTEANTVVIDNNEEKLVHTRPAKFEPVRFELTTPIRVKGQETWELTLKQPTARCFIQNGSFMRKVEVTQKDVRTNKMSTTSHNEVDYTAVISFIADMSDTTTLDLDILSAHDVERLAIELARIVFTSPL